jgi:hypothetical protein
MSESTKCPLVPYLLQLFGLGVVGVKQLGAAAWHVLKLQKRNHRRLLGANTCSLQAHLAKV